MTDYRPLTDGGFTLPTAANDDAGSISLGLEFIVTTACWLKGFRWLQPSTGPVKTDARTAALYTTTAPGTTGTKVTADVSGAPSGSGWQQLTLPAAYALSAGVVYRAVVHHPTEGYAATGGFYDAGGPGGDAEIVAGPVTVRTKASALVGQNLFAAGAAGGAMQFPASTFAGGNYWVDVLVSDTDPGLSPVWTWSVTARQG